MDRCLRSLSALTCVVVMSIPAQTWAGNNYDVLPGARAALLGGAYTALAEDGSASYWNPAGLGWIQYPSFDVSGSAYEFRWMRGSGFISITGGGQAANDTAFKASQMLVIPTLASYVFPIYRKPKHSHVLAVSILVLKSVDFSSQYNTDDTIGGLPFRLSVDQTLTMTLYAMGPSYGARIGKYLSVGCSLLLYYHAFVSSMRFRSVLGDPNAPSAVGIVIPNEDLKDIGLQAVVGVQVRPWKGLRLGVTFRSPVMLLYSMGTVSEISAEFGGQLQAAYHDRHEEISEFDFAMRLPLSISFGAGYESPGSWAVSADADYFAPISGENLTHTFNVRVGAEIFVKKRWAIQFGFFTDLDNQDELEGISTNYFGLALGVTWRKVLCIEDKRWLKFIETTVGLKYVFGLGDMVGVTVSRDTGQVGTATASFAEHDIGLIVGSRLNF